MLRVYLGHLETASGIWADFCKERQMMHRSFDATGVLEIWEILMHLQVHVQSKV